MIKAEFELNVTILVFKSLERFIRKRFLAKKCNEDYTEIILFSYDLFIPGIISVTVTLLTASSSHPLAHAGPGKRTSNVDLVPSPNQI